MSKLYDLLQSMINKIKNTEEAIPKKLSDLNNDLEIVSSWNDLEDKPFYEETVTRETEILPRTTIELSSDDATPPWCAGATDVAFTNDLKAGDRCVITVSNGYDNGDHGDTERFWGVYECTAIDIQEKFGVPNSLVIVGDPYYVSGKESFRTNEAPFCFVPSMGMIVGEPGAYTFTITKVTSESTVKTIDEKYIPDAVKYFYETTKEIEINETCNAGSYLGVENDALVDMMKNAIDVSNVVVTLDPVSSRSDLGGVYSLGEKYEDECWIEYELRYSDGSVCDSLSVHYNKDENNIEVFYTGAPDGFSVGLATFTGYYTVNEMKSPDSKYIKDMYYDKTTITKTEILPRTSLTFSELPDANDGVYICENIPFSGSIDAGDKCVVTVYDYHDPDNPGGTYKHSMGVYECTAFEYDGDVVIGDLYYATHDNSTRNHDGPFFFSPVYGIGVIDDPGVYSIDIVKVSKENELKPIDEKYLPGSCRQFVVTIHTEGSGVEISSHSSSEIRDAVAKGYNVVFDMYGNKVPFLAFDGDIAVFSAVTGYEGVLVGTTVCINDINVDYKDIVAPSIDIINELIDERLGTIQTAEGMDF